MALRLMRPATCVSTPGLLSHRIAKCCFIMLISPCIPQDFLQRLLRKRQQPLRYTAWKNFHYIKKPSHRSWGTEILRGTTLIPVNIRTLYHVPTYAFPVTWKWRRRLMLIQRQSSGRIFLCPPSPVFTTHRLSGTCRSRLLFPVIRCNNFKITLKLLYGKIIFLSNKIIIK